MFRITKKRLLTGLSALAVLGAAGGAIAFWTSGGSGTATGTVGSTGTITLSGTIAPGLVPGGSEAVTLTASNAGTAPVKLQAIKLVSVAVDAGHSACTTADFTMPEVMENESIPGGATNHALATSGTLSYANTAVSQNACEGATLTLTLSST
jgi:hypothetical protein